MVNDLERKSSKVAGKGVHPFRRAVLRGLALLLPPLLTIVIFLWVWNTIREYVLVPVETGSQRVIVWSIQDIHDAPPSAEYSSGIVYKQVPGREKYVPAHVLDAVVEDPGPNGMPATAEAVYRRYVEIRYLNWYQVIPIFLLVLVLILYFLGKFLAAGIGRIFWNFFDRIIHRLPVVRNVYGAVKQVTDFVFSEREIEYTRVVAVEYPRKGLWSVGFVTGESMLDIESAANEPVLSVLMPTSPMPATGFTITVKKSETVDLNITVEEAIQFVVSCGVVIPLQQLRKVQSPLDNGRLENSATD